MNDIRKYPKRARWLIALLIIGGNAYWLTDSLIYLYQYHLTENLLDPIFPVWLLVFNSICSAACILLGQRILSFRIHPLKGLARCMQIDLVAMMLTLFVMI